MSSSDLQPYEFMQEVVDFLERESVPYRIVGSLASIIYGEPRFTNDVDILLDLPQSKVDALCQQFPPPDFYVSAIAVREAIAERRQFNILHIPSGLKADLILSDDTEFGRLDISRGQRVRSEGYYNALFASAENVILKKLLYFQHGGSEKHLRDITGVITVQADRIDQAYLDHWAKKLGVTKELALVRRKLDERED